MFFIVQPSKTGILGLEISSWNPKREFPIIVGLRLVSAVYFFVSLTVLNQLMSFIYRYEFHVSVAFIRSCLTLSSQPNFPVPFSLMCDTHETIFIVSV